MSLVMDYLKVTSKPEKGTTVIMKKTLKNFMLILNFLNVEKCRKMKIYKYDDNYCEKCHYSDFDSEEVRKYSGSSG